ncbi:MAG: hypothetical protein ACEPO8_09660 [Rhodothermaceae bacterium]
MRLGIIVLLFAFLATGRISAQQKINETIVKYIDVTGDKVKDKTTLKLKAENIDAPFKWNLSIVSNGNKILDHKADDTIINKLFTDKNFVDEDCKNYKECKKQYYYSYILGNLISGIDVDRNYDSISSTIKEELKEKTKLSDKEIEQLTEKIISRIRRKELAVVSIHESPVQRHFPIVYVKEINKFVIVYKW